MFTTSNTKESLGRNLTSKQFSLFFIRKLELNCENLPENESILISTIENASYSNLPSLSKETIYVHLTQNLFTTILIIKGSSKIALKLNYKSVFPKRCEQRMPFLCPI